MIPLNAAEARDCLRSLTAQIERGTQQAAHFGRLQEIESERVRRLEAEARRIALMQFSEPTPSPDPRALASACPETDQPA